MAATAEQIEELANREYRYGFVTEIKSRPSTIRMSGCQGVSFCAPSFLPPPRGTEFPRTGKAAQVAARP